MRIPFEVKDISNPEELFGREQLLKSLLVDASLKQNINIIGSRRFGKTCVLKSAYTLLKSNDDLSVYPIFLDFKSEDIHGTVEVYRFLVATLTTSLYQDGIFTDPEKFGSVTIRPSDDWSEVAEQLESLSKSRIQSLFERIVKWFSELMERTILLMIDEYEYLFKYALDTPTGFFKLRKLSSCTNSDGFAPFCFWLTGSTPWDQLISEVPGSGEANTISAVEYVAPISREAFEKMWTHECEMVEDKGKKTTLLSYCEFAYEKSGGVPFYGKNVIGSYIYKNGIQPDYTVCQGYFQELSNKAFNSGDYKILKELAIAPKKMKSSNSFNNLKNLGIIGIKTKDIYSISIGFLKDFILGEISDTKGGSQVPESYTLMKVITDKIELINKQRVNYHKRPVFPPVMDISSLEYDLRTPCFTKEQLSDFASALYKYFYERLKESKEEFGRFLYGKFGKCVDIARHSLGGGHEMDFFNQHNDQFTRADLFVEIMGNADELSSSHDYYKFQLEMLKRFKETLESVFMQIKRH